MNINSPGEHIDRPVTADLTQKTDAVSSASTSGVSNPQDFFDNSGELGLVRALVD